MNIQSLKIIINNRKLRRADLARMAGVSRAAVTKWFHQAEKSDWINMETGSLIQLCKSLGIEPAILMTSVARLEPYTTRFLWDRLYSDMESFIAAISKNEQPAMARLIQVVGFHEAMEITGKKIMSEFPKYKKFIKPARRKQLEILWPLYNSPA